jgi:hypothetical protein
MEKANLNHAPPEEMEKRYIEEIRQMSYQKRFEKMIAIMELSNLVKNAKIIFNANSKK